VERNPLKWPLTCLSGIVVILVYCVFTATAWALYPDPYGPVTHYLSRLGNWGKSPFGAFFYNAGCVLTGAALIPFFIGLYEWYGEQRWRAVLLLAGQALGLSSAAALMMIGVFSEDFGQSHRVASTAFFVLLFLVLIEVNLALLTHPGFLKAIAFYGFAIDAVSLGLELTISGPITEWFTVFAALSYVGLLVINTFKLAYPDKRG
jgi:hypothetical membrane protein